MRKGMFFTSTGVDITGLISYYRYNDDVTDAIGGRDGTDTPTLPYVTGKSGKAGDFNVTNQFKVDVGNSAAFQLTTGSLSCFIKTSDAGSGFRGIFVKQFAYSLFAIDGVIGFFDWGASATRSSGINIEDGAWHHLVLTFQSGVTNGTKIYIDSVLKLTTDMTVSAQTQVLLMGYGNASNQYYKGLLDGAGVWNVELTQTRVTEIYNHQNAGNELV